MNLKFEDEWQNSYEPNSVGSAFYVIFKICKYPLAFHSLSD